jgi:hypothetical protein
MQLATEVKKRWTDEILYFKKYIIKVGKTYCLPQNVKAKAHKHCRDSIRHAVHYATFKNEKETKR